MLETTEIAPDLRLSGISLFTKTFIWIDSSGIFTLFTRSKSRRSRLDKGNRYIEQKLKDLRKLLKLN